LTNDTFKITKIDGRGVPVSPLKHAKGFSNAVGCIVSETVKITCTDIRGKDKENLRGCSSTGSSTGIPLKMMKCKDRFDRKHWA